MLIIDKKDVDFLVTSSLVGEVQDILKRDLPVIKCIVDTVSKTGIDRVYFVACGSPLSAAITATQLFDLYSHIECRAFSGFDFLDSTPLSLDEKSLVIGISQSGETEEVNQSLIKAKTHGAPTVAITNTADCPMAEITDHVVAYHAEAIWEAHLLTTYAFAYEIISRVEVDAAEITTIYQQLSQLPAYLEKMIGVFEEPGRALGEKASHWSFIYTIAAGPLLPLAYKEGIISLLEFTWTHGSVLNASEFRHGPLEVVEEGVPYIFLLGTDESRHTTQRALDFVKRYSQDVIVFDYADYCEELHPMLSPFVMFIPMEWFCYYLAIYKDHNPDNRRYYGGLANY
ncbi:MAG TPA: fructoselysine-6-P-deglycase [Anaerolineaceae bacterium]|nr:fructoselysine-6-P-deglycase [Anaerolineaceae bacterium]